MPETRDDTLRLESFRGYLRVLAQASLRAAGPVRGKLDASDLVQETLLKAHTRLDQFQGTSREEMAGWLRATLANQLTDAARRFGRHKRDAALERRYVETIERSASSLHSLVIMDGATPADELMRFERVLRLAAALDGLPEDQRRAVELHHLAGHSVVEVAQEMGRTRAAVAGLLRRGLQQLRSSLDEAEVT